MGHLLGGKLEVVILLWNQDNATLDQRCTILSIAVCVLVSTTVLLLSQS